MNQVIYQIILLGCEHELLNKVREEIKTAFARINLPPKSCSFFTVRDMDKCKFGKFPTIALYFADSKVDSCGQELKKLKDEVVTIIPIVPNFDSASSLLPDDLKEINAACVSNPDDSCAISNLLNLVLSNLGLLIKEKNVFISYKRKDCEVMANQLYSRLLLDGYNVFLDTKSLVAGVNFQHSLMHRLADSFVLLLLNSEHFFDEDSKWTLEEYLTAQELQLGICGITLPKGKYDRTFSFHDIYDLQEGDFTDLNNLTLKDEALDCLSNHVSYIYARLYESRKQAVVNTFVGYLNKNSIPYQLEHDGTIRISSSKQTCIVVPLIGIPKSWNYYVSDMEYRLKNKIPVYILYNNQYVLEEWLNHLNWLERKSGINPIDINNSQLWINENL